VTLFLNPRFWWALALASALAFTHWFVYKSGKAQVRAEWDTAKIAQLQLTKEADRENRNIEAARNRNVIEAQNAAVARAVALEAVLAATSSDADRLRDQIRANRLQLPRLAEQALRQYSDAASAVLSECLNQYQGMAKAADTATGDVQTLIQAWPKK
jgi:hypothetical protein